MEALSMITPKDIQTVEFASSMRGYNKQAVDEFLDRVTADYQALVEENRRLYSEKDELQRKLEEAKNSGVSAKDTLEQARKLLSDISSSAEKRAEIIVKNANLDAENITRNARESVERYTEEAELLKKRLAEFRAKYRDLLKTEMEKLDDTVNDLFSDLKGDFYPEEAALENGLVSTQEISRKDLSSAVNAKDAGPFGNDAPAVSGAAGGAVAFGAAGPVERTSAPVQKGPVERTMVLDRKVIDRADSSAGEVREVRPAEPHSDMKFTEKDKLEIAARKVEAERAVAEANKPRYVSRDTVQEFIVQKKAPSQDASANQAQRRMTVEEIIAARRAAQMERAQQQGMSADRTQTLIFKDEDGILR